MNLTLNARTRGAILLALVVAIAAGAIALIHTLMPFVVAFALVYLLNPAVSALARLKFRGRAIGRAGGVVGVYCAFFLLLWFCGLFVMPRLYEEFMKLAHFAPRELVRFEQHVLPDWVIQGQGYLDSYNVPFDLRRSVQDGMTAAATQLQGEFGELMKGSRDLVAGFFGAILSTVLVFMLTGFLLYDLPRLKTFVYGLVPSEYRGGLESLAADIDRGLAGAVRGQLVVCLVNGTLTTIGLWVMHVHFAVTLGVVAGVCSLIPVFGTLISTIPAVLVGLTHSPLTGLLVLAWILLIHLLEANVLNPKIVGHNTELHPALVVLALLLGEHFGGPLGLLIAVPFATVVRAIATYTLGRLLRPEEPAPAAEPLPEPEPITRLVEPPQAEAS